MTTARAKTVPDGHWLSPAMEEARSLHEHLEKDTEIDGTTLVQTALQLVMVNQQAQLLRLLTVQPEEEPGSADGVPV